MPVDVRDLLIVAMGVVVYFNASLPIFCIVLGTTIVVYANFT